MQIITTITVKQILTETSKQKLKTSFHLKKQQLLNEIEQLKFEMRRLEKTNKFSNERLRSYFNKQMDERSENIKQIDFQIEQLEILPLGSELKETEIQGLVSVEVGDNWNESLLQRTITIKDGIIEDIK
ncbi:YlqD family protein [Bacillus andreraoultii]|uniref:YlqD family protein n=1 Tax=Bacillus andreraoultii TaxID=1499685 RepID=UPI00053A4E03|nr:YlqD family protein [Bacillus andreraoultii]